MAKAKLNSAFIATVAGEITVYNYRGRHPRIHILIG
ncbi:Uncharacterised protein [Escherichia coli]|nr:Uncharacterised protein [Escherichia coli]